MFRNYKLWFSRVWVVFFFLVRLFRLFMQCMHILCAFLIELRFHQITFMLNERITANLIWVLYHLIAIKLVIHLYLHSILRPSYSYSGYIFRYLLGDYFSPLLLYVKCCFYWGRELCHNCARSSKCLECTLSPKDTFQFIYKKYNPMEQFIKTRQFPSLNMKST